MAPRSRGIRNVLEAITKPTSMNAHVCLSCRHVLSKRTYASAATAQATIESLPFNSTTSDGPTTSSIPQTQVSLKAGVVLSRPPLLTPDPHPFETAFHFYQRRLNERLVLPFTQYFYFRRGTPAFDHWRTRRRDRGGAATRDIGKYNAYDKESWNDEVLLGDETGQPKKILEQLVEEEGRAEEFAGEQGDIKLAGLRRTTEADQSEDQKSLERSLSRTLYLLVKSKPKSKDEPENTLWQFPSGSPEGKESLKEAAQRILGTSCGPNMNTWFVGNHPIGYLTRELKAIEDIKQSKAEVEETATEEKTFFMKARIMAGQADVKSKENEVEDFRWLAKEEVEKTVSAGYWSKIKNMLVEQ